MRKSFWIFVFAAALAVPAFASGGESGGGSLLAGIAVSIIAASVMGFIARALRQPLLLAYIAAGILVGPELGLRLVSSRGDVQTISEIGLVLLLFLIGLEMDIKKLRDSGKALVLAGTLQFAVCAGLGLLALPFILPFADGYAVFYLAVCLALSSTAIVVKILYAKSELDTVPGRITLGVLVFQDVWAIVVLAVQPNLSHPDFLGLLASFGKGGLLVAASLAASRWVLPRLFKSTARLPELLLVASLGWCFLVCSAASLLGLSIEMGALIAGVAISTFPYNLDVIAKVVSIRDFFVTLFFVSLGMMVPNPLGRPELLGAAALCVVFLVATRFLSISPLLYALKQGHRISLIPAINLANVSEFSLVIAALGVGAGHIGQDVLSVVVFAFVISSAAAPYLIQNNGKIQKALARGLTRLGLRETHSAEEEEEAEEARDIVLLGFYRVASSLVNAVEEEEAAAGTAPEKSLFRRMAVIDFNPNIRERLTALGVRVVYGDLAHMDTLHHAGLHGAKLVVSTVADTMLVGIDNLRLVRQMRLLAPHARIVVSAESAARALRMYAEGADYVLLTRDEAAGRLRRTLEVLLSGDAGEAERLRAAHAEALGPRREIIS